MAQTIITVSVETELLADALAELDHIMSRLAFRHGEAFRDVERRIARLIDGAEPLSGFGMADLGPGRLVLLPPSELAAVIADARRLGVA